MTNYIGKASPSILKRIMHFGKALAIGLIITLSASGLAQAYVGDLHTIVTTSNSKQTPDIAYNTNTDRYLVVWREKITSSNWNIVGGILDSNGNYITGPFNIEAVGDNSLGPSVAPAADSGDWIVAWAQEYVLDWRVRACRISSTGGSECWWVTSGTLWIGEAEPDIGVDIWTGKFLVVWKSENAYAMMEIRGRLLDRSSGPMGDEFTILDTPPLGHDKTNPSVSQRGYGFFVVAEKEYTSSTQLEGRYVSGDGSMRHSAYDVYTSGENRAPDVAAAQNLENIYEYVVTWHRENDADDWDIYYAKCGLASCSNTGSVANSSKIEFNPSVSFTGIAGQYVVAYGIAPRGDWNGNWDIHIESLRNDGTLGSEEILIDTSMGEGSPVGSTLGGATGDVILTWDRFSGTVPDKNLYARLYSFYGPPGAFSKSSPANGASGQPTNPTLSWGSSSGATSYEYCYDTSNDNACSSWTTNGTSTSKTLSSLTAGTTYYWQVRARNAAGPTEANGGAWWYFTTATSPPGAFNKSSPANGASGQPTNPTLSWGSSSGATSYEYCYDTSNDNACSSWTPNGTSTSKTLSSLSAGTTYYWQVRARNAAGPTEANGGAWWYFTTEQAGLMNWYVSPTGNNGNNCQSTSTACRTIQGALNKASSGDIIHIAAGTYIENISIETDISLQGERPETTILDGGGIDSVITIDGSCDSCSIRI